MDFIACDTLIPGKLVRFLEHDANVAFAGSRDRDLVPFGHRVSGWRVGPDHRTLTILFPDECLPRLVESLQQNRELAFTVEAFPSHETYQFKGHYTGHREIDGGDVEAAGRIRQRWVKGNRMFSNIPEDVLKGFVSPPSLAVDIEVLEIYLQTPGPGAGTRLVPPLER
jgi:hypothetical protein